MLRYAGAYRGLIAIVLVTIVLISVLTALQPLVVARLIDVAIPDEDLRMVSWLGLALVGIALGNGVIGVAQRWGLALGAAIMGAGRRYPRDGDTGLSAAWRRLQELKNQVATISDASI